MQRRFRGRRSPTRASLGTASLSISNLLVFSSTAKLEIPVTLPPGRARLAIKPAPTGSAEFVITMGMVVVAFLAAKAAVPSMRPRSIDLETNKVRRMLRQTVIFLLGKPVLGGNILSLDPSKLAHLLPERLQEDRDTGSIAWIQESYAEDFFWLLRVRGGQKSEIRWLEPWKVFFFSWVSFSAQQQPSAPSPGNQGDGDFAALHGGSSWLRPRR